jgi:hypothetical protein
MTNGQQWKNKNGDGGISTNFWIVIFGAWFGTNVYELFMLMDDFISQII